jgi:Fe-S oxidoreductase
MIPETVTLGASKQTGLLDQVMQVLPEGGNLNLCLTCGMCSSGCPAAGIDDMDPRKMLRMIALGLDDQVLASDWPWMCTMCQRCIYVCPMQIDIPQLIYNLRAQRPRQERPKGILGSCDMALKTDTNSAMGVREEDFSFVVEDVLEQYRQEQPEFEKMAAPIDKAGAEFFLNQNSREPMTEADEMVPLWKILHLAGVDWTYGSKGWAGENYCMFLADDAGWEHVVRTQTEQTHQLKCKTYLNTE